MPGFKGKGHKLAHEMEGVSMLHCERTCGMGHIVGVMNGKIQHTYTQS